MYSFQLEQKFLLTQQNFFPSVYSRVSFGFAVIRVVLCYKNTAQILTCGRNRLISFLVSAAWGWSGYCIWAPCLSLATDTLQRRRMQGNRIWAECGYCGAWSLCLCSSVPTARGPGCPPKHRHGRGCPFKVTSFGVLGRPGCGLNLCFDCAVSGGGVSSDQLSW